MTIKYKTVKHLNDKKFPTHSKRYPYAHKEANKAEKKDNPKAYQEINRLERKVGKHELLGKNTKSGKIEVSVKVPKKDRKNVAVHEKRENDILRRKK